MKKVGHQISITGLVFTLLVIQLVPSCSDTGTSRKKETANEGPAETVPAAYKKPPSTFSDTLAINAKSAVFFNPDSLQLEKIRATTPKNMYESDVHNCFYQMRNARMVLKKYYPRIHIIVTSKARFILFIKASKSKIYVHLDTKGDRCGIFLFKKKKDPELIDMMNIDTALGFYFK